MPDYITGPGGHVGGVTSGSIDSITRKKPKKDIIDYALDAQDSIKKFFAGSSARAAEAAEPITRPRPPSMDTDSYDPSSVPDDDKYRELAKKKYLPRSVQLRMLLEDKG